MNPFRRSPALRICVAYLLVGALWVLLSDALVARLFPPSGWSLVQTLEGWIFVVGSAALLYWLVRHETGRLRRLRTQRQELEEELRERERRHEFLMEEISDVVTILDEQGTIAYESPSVKRVFGYEPAELMGRRAFDLVHPEDRERVMGVFAEALASPGLTRTVQYRFRNADGSWRFVESKGVLSEATELGPVVVTRDISERRRMAEKYRAIFNTSPSPVGLTTLEEGRFVEVNDAFEELFGYRREEVVGRTVGELGIWATPGMRRRIVRAVAERGAVHTREVRLRAADGEIVDVLFSASAIELHGVPHLVAVAQDIRERKEFEARLERQALIDDLTELPNRHLFHDRLVHALERAKRKDERVALLFIDLDRFKNINDSLGHSAGDAVLRSVAARLTDCLRAEDTVARFGGDEYAVLIEGVTDAAEIQETADRIRRALEPPFEVGDTEFSLAASIGIAHSGIPFEDPDDLIRLADAAMYRVKGPGSTDVHVYDPSEDEQITERLHREAELRRAVEREEFTVHYHPVYELRSGELAGAEALVRWNHPERGLVPPAEFIPVAEESGLVVPMGMQVLRMTLREARRWRSDGLVDAGRFRVSVNLSVRQYQEADLEERIRREVRAAGLPFSMLNLELTETILMTGRGRLQELREAGIGVVIDDFGTGYSSLQYLRSLPADGLKIDRSFVSGPDMTDVGFPIVRGILFMAAELGLYVIAEGIETERQLEALREAGCRYGQGTLFSRPLPAGELGALLREDGPLLRMHG